MAVTARIAPDNGYINHTYPNGTPKAIQITGEIVDDEIVDANGDPKVWRGTYWIEGEELASLPPADPELDGTPEDPRFQAIQLLVARFVKKTHAVWRTAELGIPTEEVKPAEVIAQFPTITQEILDLV